MQRITVNSKLGTLFATTLALVVLAAATAASASATTCHQEVGAKKYVLCIAGVEQGFPTETASVSVAVALKPGTSARVGGSFLGGSYVACKKIEGNVVLKSAEGIGGIKAGALVIQVESLRFKQCAFEGASECIVSSFVLEHLSGRFGAGAEPVTFYTPPRANFPGSLRISAENGCPAYGTYQFKAKALEHEEYEGPKCTLSQPAVESAEHLLNCEKQNSNLTAGGKTVNLSVELTVALSGSNEGHTFSIIEGT